VYETCPSIHSAATLYVSKRGGCINLTYGNLNVSLRLWPLFSYCIHASYGCPFWM